MADATLLESFLSALGGASAGVGTLIGLVRRHLRRVTKLESHFKEGGRVVDLEARLANLWGTLDEKLQTYVAQSVAANITSSVQAAITAALARASFTNEVNGKPSSIDGAKIRAIAIKVARDAVQEFATNFMKEIARVEDELRGLRQHIEKAASGEAFTEHIAAEAERWNEVHRALGQIEGMLEVVRDRLNRTR